LPARLLQFKEIIDLIIKAKKIRINVTMILQSLSRDRLEILSIIKNIGCSVCVGTCEHRKPGELHCHNIGRKLKISSAGVKRRMREMVQTGLLNRERVERRDGKVMAKYTVSEKGLALLDEIY
jgi:DNA-binding HxlR family transcriptional regulator